MVRHFGVSDFLAVEINCASTAEIRLRDHAGALRSMHRHVLTRNL